MLRVGLVAAVLAVAVGCDAQSLKVAWASDGRRYALASYPLQEIPLGEFLAVGHGVVAGVEIAGGPVSGFGAWVTGRRDVSYPDRGRVRSPFLESRAGVAMLTTTRKPVVVATFSVGLRL